MAELRPKNVESLLSTAALGPLSSRTEHLGTLFPAIACDAAPEAVSG